MRQHFAHWVASGKCKAVTECFSKFNSYNTCNDVIDDKKIELASLQFKNVLSLYWDC